MNRSQVASLGLIGLIRLDLSGPVEQLATREKPVEHHSQPIDLRCIANVLTRRLFWRHVVTSTSVVLQGFFWIKLFRHAKIDQRYMPVALHRV